MDTRTGRIRSSEEVAALGEEERAFFRPMELEVTPRQKATGKVGRNEPCPCSSGKKFKHCCLLKAESATKASQSTR